MSAQEPTSQTLREQIEQLIASWRKSAAGAVESGYYARHDRAHALEDCADELKAILGQAADRLASLEQGESWLITQLNEALAKLASLEQEQQARERERSRVLPVTVSSPSTSK